MRNIGILFLFCLWVIELSLFFIFVNTKLDDVEWMGISIKHHDSLEW